MKAIVSRRNAAIFCAVLVALVLAALSLPRTALAQKPPSHERIGQYQLPDLPGWSRTINRRPARVHTITRNGKTRRYKMPAKATAVYTRTTNGARLTLSLDAWDWERPLSAKEMLQGLQAAQKIETMMSGVMAKKTGGTSTPMQITSETFRGLPAYAVTQNFTDKHAVVTETRGRHFVDKMSSYDQEMEIKGAVITSGMRRAANNGWQKLSDGLRAVK